MDIYKGTVLPPTKLMFLGLPNLVVLVRTSFDFKPPCLDSPTKFSSGSSLERLGTWCNYTCLSDNIPNAIGVARYNMSIISLLRLRVILLPVHRPPAAAIWNDWELDVHTQLKCFPDNIPNAIGVSRHNMSIVSFLRLRASCYLSTDLHRQQSGTTGNLMFIYKGAVLPPTKHMFLGLPDIIWV
jgi:hypothetical protein